MRIHKYLLLFSIIIIVFCNCVHKNNGPDTEIYSIDKLQRFDIRLKFDDPDPRVKDMLCANIWIEESTLTKQLGMFELYVRLTTTRQFDDEIIVILSDGEGKIFEQISSSDKISLVPCTGSFIPYTGKIRFRVPQTLIKPPLLVTFKTSMFQSVEDPVLFQTKLIPANSSSGDAIPNSKK